MKAHSGRIEVRPALRHIAALRNTWAAARASACRHDGIPADAKFAVFSDNNPFVVFSDKAASMYFEAVQTYQSGGYVGLQIVEGRAR